MAELNEESKKFISWVESELDDPIKYEKIISQIVAGVLAYYGQPKHIIMEKLKEKLTKGGMEHGEPIYPLEFVLKELENEFIDLLGWELVAYYNQPEKQLPV